MKRCPDDLAHPTTANEWVALGRAAGLRCKPPRELELPSRALGFEAWKADLYEKQPKGDRS